MMRYPDLSICGLPRGTRFPLTIWSRSQARVREVPPRRNCAVIGLTVVDSGRAVKDTRPFSLVKKQCSLKICEPDRRMAAETSASTLPTYRAVEERGETSQSADRAVHRRETRY